MRTVKLAVLCIAITMCMLGCSSPSPTLENKGTAIGESQNMITGRDEKAVDENLKVREPISAINEVPDKLNDALDLVPDCDLKIEEGDGDSFPIYHNLDKVGSLKLYPDDYSFAVFSNLLDEDDPESVANCVNLATASILVSDTSYDVSEAKKIVLKVAESEKLREGSVNYSMGKIDRQSVFIVEL